MHKKSFSLCANHKVVDGDLVTMGDLSLRVLHTPGHTRDSICLVLPDRILSGDSLFIGASGAGRTDLPGGDSGEHWDSLAKLAEFPDEMLVFPAHDYHGLTQSTLGAERQNNPRLQARPREAYVQWLEELQEGPADWTAGMVKCNYASARDPRTAWVPVDLPACEVRGTQGSVNAATIRTMPVEKLWRELIAGSPPHLLDVRQPEEYVGTLGRIPGSMLIPIAELPKRLDEMTGLENQRICCVCRSGCRSATASAILSVSGFKNVFSLHGGMVAWREYERQRAVQTSRWHL
jgi:rhodanese-related sulfurtransferase